MTLSHSVTRKWVTRTIEITLGDRRVVTSTLRSAIGPAILCLHVAPRGQLLVLSRPKLYRLQILFEVKTGDSTHWVCPNGVKCAA